jgi:hypothetical protein
VQYTKPAVPDTEPTTWQTITYLASPAVAGYAKAGKYDPAGNLLWTSQFGTNGLDSAYGVAVDGLSTVYVSGST